MTPPLVEHPGMEPHIHPFQIYSLVNNTKQPLYLHTSPEFKLKQLLSMKDEPFQNIYSLSYVFRDEPHSSIHRQQFLMLEWYQKNAPIEDVITTIQNLLSYVYQQHSLLKGKQSPTILVKSMQNLFLEIIQIDILNYLEIPSLRNLITTEFKDVPMPKVDLAWDDLFFLLFLNKIEPELKKFPFLILTDFPSPLSALAQINPNDSRTAKRFEFYISGIEIANCYQELLDPKEMESRFKIFEQMKHDNYSYTLPYPKEFMQTMNNGLPASSGIAMGIERLLKALTQIENPFVD